MAVSKFQPVEKIIEALQNGQSVFGENYVQELLEKKEELERRGISGFEFHFIGKLQTNKVKALLPHVRVIHSVDSVRLLKEIEKRAEEFGLHPEVFFQVNIDEELTKSGFLPKDLAELGEVAHSARQVIPKGLMAIPNPERDPADAFRRMQSLSEQHGSLLGRGLSMGMSSDYREAIQYGSTWIRIGSAIFGERPEKRS